MIVGLKTVKGTKQLKLDPTIYDALIKEKVHISLLHAISCCLLEFLIFSSMLFTLLPSYGNASSMYF